MKLKQNVGGYDRMARLVGGSLLLGLGLLRRRGARGNGLFSALGALALETGLTRFCPINRALGLRTA
jgi:hypothetical protein